MLYGSAGHCVVGLRGVAREPRTERGAIYQGSRCGWPLIDRSSVRSAQGKRGRRCSLGGAAPSRSGRTQEVVAFLPLRLSRRNSRGPASRPGSARHVWRGVAWRDSQPQKTYSATHRLQGDAAPCSRSQGAVSRLLLSEQALRPLPRYGIGRNE